MIIIQSSVLLEVYIWGLRDIEGTVSYSRKGKVLSK